MFPGALLADSMIVASFGGIRSELATIMELARGGARALPFHNLTTRTPSVCSSSSMVRVAGRFCWALGWADAD
jgi:hypothetical protein